MDPNMALLDCGLHNIKPAEPLLKSLWSQWSRQIKKNASKLIRIFIGKKKRNSVQCVLIYFSHCNLTGHSPLSCCLTKSAAQSWFMTSSLLFYYQLWRTTACLWTLDALKKSKNKQLNLLYLPYTKFPALSTPLTMGEFLLCPLQTLYTAALFYTYVLGHKVLLFLTNGKPTNHIIPVCFAIK